MSAPADCLFKGACIVDGTGAKAFIGDVAIAGQQIVAVGRLNGLAAEHTERCEGLVLAPGFIDIHTHADVALLRQPRAEPAVFQGVTTQVFSNCGIGFAPLTDSSVSVQRDLFGPVFGPDEGVDWSWRSVGEYLDRLDGHVATNVVFLVPHAALRIAVMGLETRPANEEERNQMCRLLRESLEAGAAGLSTSPWYAPLCAAEAREFRELMGVVREYGGVYATHMRSYTSGLLSSLQEEIEHSAQTGVPVQVSHLACVGKPNWGLSERVLEMLAKARERGIDITCDSYPYLAGCTLLFAMLPNWVKAEGPQHILEKVRHPQTRARIVADLSREYFDWSQGQICGVATEKNKPLEGRGFAEVARERGICPAELVCALLDEEDLKVSFLIHTGNEADMRTILASPFQMVGSDGLHLEGRTHPRLFGTFPRVLGRYVREERVLTLEQAIHKMTGAPAARLGLKDRGILRPGAAADLVLFDPNTVSDTATYEDPCRFPVGIRQVLVNGTLVLRNGKHTGALPGRVLRKR